MRRLFVFLLAFVLASGVLAVLPVGDVAAGKGWARNCIAHATWCASVAGPIEGGAPAMRERHHTTTIFRFMEDGASVYWPNFTINNGVIHYIQQTYPHLNCYHRVYRAGTSTVVGAAWLNASGSNTMGVGNVSGSSIYVSHTAYCVNAYTGNVGAKYFHGTA